MNKVSMIVYVAISIMMIGLGVASANTGELGNFVWNDLNFNGIQDATEQGIAGVTVYLEDRYYNRLQTTSTDSDGKYLFSDLVPDKYVLEFVAPYGTSFTLKKQGSDKAVDSNANPRGHSDFITLTTNHPANLNIDARLKSEPRAPAQRRPPHGFRPLGTSGVA